MFRKTSLVFAALFFICMGATNCFAQNDKYACEAEGNAIADNNNGQAYENCLQEKYRQATCAPLKIFFLDKQEEVKHNELRLECYANHFTALRPTKMPEAGSLEISELMQELPATILYNPEFSKELDQKQFTRNSIAAFYEKNIKLFQLQSPLSCEKAFEDKSRDGQYEYNLCFERADSKMRNYYILKLNPFPIDDHGTVIMIDMADITGNYSECSIAHLHYNERGKNYEVDNQSPWLRCG